MKLRLSFNNDQLIISNNIIFDIIRRERGCKIKLSGLNDADDKNTPVLRNTRQKSVILKCLQENTGNHMTADDIIDFLKNKKIPVAKATVYRYLARLEESGLVKKYIISEQQPACYQYLGGNEPCLFHFHLMCQVCGQIEHFENASLQKMFGDIKNDEGFFIDGRKTVFYGTCKACTTD